MQRVKRFKAKEKHSMFEYLNKMSIEERKIENMWKNYKIGKWNVGMQKGLVQYDSLTNERETKDLIGHLLQDMSTGTTDVVNEMMIDIYDLGNGINTAQTMMDVEDLDNYENQLNGEFYDNEANGIQDLGENYQDGEYYEEDRDEDSE
jgi:hypothetical protein